MAWLTKIAEEQHAPKSSPALDTYAKWRPRLRRGLGWAATGAFLGKTVGGDMKGIAHIATPTILAGLAGASDATLEEKLREQAHMKHIVERGYEETHMKKKGSMDDNDLLTSSSIDAQHKERTLDQLFSRKALLEDLSSKQLKSLFSGSDECCLGRGVRLASGQVGAVEHLFSMARK